MSGWRTVTLRDVATIERNAIEATAIRSGTRYIGLEDIASGGKILGVHTVDSGELASNKFTFAPRHLLYGKLRPYLAKIARPQFVGICSTDILPILPGPELDRDYLAHYLLTPQMVSQANSRATGANLPRISPQALGELRIPLPQLSEQRRIAEVLDRTDALRAKRRAALAQLDTLSRSIFTNLLRQEGTRVPTFSIEDGMEAIIDYRGKSPKKTASGIPLITARIVKGGELLEPNEFIAKDDYATWMRRGLPKPGDVLFTTEAPLGEVAQLDERKVALAQRLLILRGKPSL